MRISNVGIELITHFEGLHDGDLSKIGLQPKPCPSGIWTVGYGYALKNKKTGKWLKSDDDYKLIAEQYPEYLNMTEIQARQLLDEVLDKYEAIVNKNLKVKVEQCQFDALVSHTYNCGVSETLYKLVNSIKKDSETLRIWWTTKYITGGGKPLNGLVARRLAEYTLFVSGELKL